MTSVFRTCPIHHKPNNPVRLGKHGTVRTTQRTQGASTVKLHCTAKTAKFFLARKLPAKRANQNMQNMLKATQTMRQLLQTTQVQNNVLPTKSQNMHSHKGTKQRVQQEPNFLSKRTPPHDRSVSSGPGSFPTSDAAPCCTQE